MFNDWPRPYDLVFGDGNSLDGWKLDLPLASPDGTNLFSDLNQDFYGSLIWSIIAKANKGLDTSMTDPWSRYVVGQLGCVSLRQCERCSAYSILQNDRLPLPQSNDS
jgi:hypothetical protein